MRKIVLALAAVAAVGLAIPTFAATPAEARDVIVINKNMHRDHGRHYGWYKHRHHRHYHGHRHHHGHHHHGPRVIIR
jgi:Ni/Co efflux regulator RcnB